MNSSSSNIEKQQLRAAMPEITDKYADWLIDHFETAEASIEYLSVDVKPAIKLLYEAKTKKRLKT